VGIVLGRFAGLNEFVEFSSHAFLERFIKRVLVGIEFALDDRQIACRKGDDRRSIEDVILSPSEHDELQNDLQNMRYEF